MKSKNIHEILKQEESWQIISSIENLATKQLLSRATVQMLNSYAQKKVELNTDFDLKFFVEAMLEFCSDHKNLRRILNGEDLRWFDDDKS